MIGSPAWRTFQLGADRVLRNKYRSRLAESLAQALLGADRVLRNKYRSRLAESLAQALRQLREVGLEGITSAKGPNGAAPQDIDSEDAKGGLDVCEHLQFGSSTNLPRSTKGIDNVIDESSIPSVGNY